MDNLDNFKVFVKKNPTFATYIRDGVMTWPEFDSFNFFLLAKPCRIRDFSF